MSKSSVSSAASTLYRIKLHGVEWIPVLLCVLMIIGIPYAVALAVRNACIRMAVTNRDVYLRTGVVTRSLDSMLLSAIESIQIRQGIGGTLLGYGEVTILGRGGDRLVLPRVANPVRVKEAIEDAINACVA